MTRQTKTIAITVLILSLYLLNSPGFFFVNKIMTTFRFAEFIWLTLFGLTCYFVFKNQAIIKSNEKINIGLITVYFISQTLSIINAVNIKVFLSRWESVFFSFIFLIVLFYLIKNKHDAAIIIRMLILSFFIPITVQLTILFFPELFTYYIAPFLNASSYNLVAYNLQKGRLYFENYNAVIIPLLFYVLYSGKNNLVKIAAVVMMAVIFFIAFISNIRSVFLLTLFAFAGSMMIVKKWIGSVVPIVLMLVFSCFIALAVSDQQLGFNIIDRFALQDNNEDYDTLVKRVELWKQAWELGLSSPILGVGLGNFFDNTQGVFAAKTHVIQNTSTKVSVLNMAEHPHNIFFATMAETGFVGLTSLILFILFFLQNDARFLLIKQARENTITKLLIVGFWSVFLYSFLNPSSSIRFYSLSWLMRVLIEKTKTYT